MNNPGYLTDAIFHRDHGSVEDKGDYYLIRTPSNPTFYWGNHLLFKSPPAPGDYEHWRKIHDQEFGTDQKHIAFGWDSSEKGSTEEFESNGFTLDDGIVLQQTTEPAPVPQNKDLNIRKIHSDQDWHAVTELQITQGCPGVSDADYRDFKTRQMNNYRASQSRGLGHWWGAFLGDEIVGDMGLFFSPDGKMGRFQAVETAPSQRRKGVCTTLLSYLIRKAFQNEGAEELFIVTDLDSVPETIYRSVGFQRLCPQRGLWNAR
ncbi:GNAT family N-acetyltransferase [Akkermansiaceae bacterium]|nr:GNAT family N-acetyltransferase [Akkermansiaceae bacterium]MDB4544738.1 GNAT family N-acetyltransferase [Akkermansiaceae bacterium]